MNAVGSSIPTTRELDTRDDARRRALRRPARVDGQRGRRLPLPAARRARSGPDHIRAEIGELLIGAGRGRRSAGRADRLQVARPRGRGSRRRRARAAGAPRPRAQARWSRSDRARGDPRVPARRSPARRSARRSCGSTSTADAEIWLKLENAAARRARSRSAARGNAILQATDAELAGGVVTASAGNMAQGVAYAARAARRAGDDRRPRARAADEDRRDRALRRPRHQACRTSEWWQVLVDRPLRGRRRPLRSPGRQRARDGGQRHDRARAARGPADLDTVVVPYGGGGLLTGIASAVKAAAARRARSSRSEPETGAPVARDARGRRRRPRSSTRRRSSTAPAAAR